MSSARWTVADVQAVLDQVGEDRYDEWHLVGVGAGTAPDGVERVSVWIAKDSIPHPGLLAWIAGLERPDIVRIREHGVADPGDGPDAETPPDRQGMPL